jgi:hypothetical protein
MSRTTRLTVIAAAAAVLSGATIAPASHAGAEELVFENRKVKSDPPEGSPEVATLDVPADWVRNRLNWHSVGFFDLTAPGKSIVLDLEPLEDTVREVRAERRLLRGLGPSDYREYAFRVADPGSKVRVRWVYAHRDSQTEDTWSYTSVFLMRGNRLVIDGRRSEREELKPIRRHVVRSVEFPG